MSLKDIVNSISGLNRDIASLQRVTGQFAELYAPELVELRELRKKFKSLYRSRPGKAFYDVQERNKRERARKKSRLFRR